MITPAIMVFITAFLVAGFSGLASLLRSEDEVKFRNISKYFLNSGILGLAVAMLWYNSYIETPFFLLGLCIVVGLTGIKGVDIALGWAQKIASSFLKIEDKEVQK